MEGGKSNLNIAEISLHGYIDSPEQLKEDKQDPSSLFTLPPNVTVMFRGGFGFSQYKIPGVIDTMMGRDPDGESFSMMLKRHNDRNHFYGSLCLFHPTSQCINLSLMDEPMKMMKGEDTSFVISVNHGLRTEPSIDIESSDEEDRIISITTICENTNLIKYFESLKNERGAKCIARQKLNESKPIYLKEVIDMLCGEYNIDMNNQLVVYVSSCQVVFDDWEKKENLKGLKKLVDVSLASQDTGYLLFNPTNLTTREKGISKLEREEGLLDTTDHGIFYGDSKDDEDDPWVVIPDNRGTKFYEWYARKFNESLNKRTKRKRISGKKKKKKKKKKTTKKRNSNQNLSQ